MPTFHLFPPFVPTMNFPMSNLMGRRQMSENINILRSLTEIPGVPLRCELLDDGHERQLSIEQERQLASDLAFVAATTEDYERIVALAIEEDQKTAGMTIRIACNSGAHSARHLEELKQGFEDVAKLLELANRRSRFQRSPIICLH